MASLSKGGEKKKRVVNVGKAGQTPKKFIPSLRGRQEDDEAESSGNNVQRPTGSMPHHNILFAEDFLSKQGVSPRPKTSRKTHEPSPDEFFDYVLPSPTGKTPPANRLVINHRAKKAVLMSDDKKITDEDELEEEGLNPVIGGSHEISNNYLLGLDLQGIDRNKQVALLGCWLFGCAMKI
jgi:hypothetical protein